MNINFCMQTQRVGNDRPLFVVVKNDRIKFKSNDLMASTELAALFSLLQLPIASVLVQS